MNKNYFKNFEVNFNYFLREDKRLYFYFEKLVAI